MSAIPIHMASPAKDLPPNAYMLIKKAQYCACGAIHESSELWAKTHLKGRWGFGGKTYVTNRRPVNRPEEIIYNLPIEVSIAPPEKLLFCHECVSATTLSHLPTPPAPIEPSHTIVGGYREQTPKASTAAKAAKFGIDDL